MPLTAAAAKPSTNAGGGAPALTPWKLASFGELDQLKGLVANGVHPDDQVVDII